jgi:hypothetical protein
MSSVDQGSQSGQRRGTAGAQRELEQVIGDFRDTHAGRPAKGSNVRYRTTLRSSPTTAMELRITSVLSYEAA